MGDSQKEERSMINVGDFIWLCEDVFIKKNQKPVYAGQRQSLVEIVSPSLPGEFNIKIIRSVGFQPDPVGVVFSKPIANLNAGKKIDPGFVEYMSDFQRMKKGGHLEGVDANGQKIVMTDAKKGGMSVGAKHTEEGIKGVVGTAQKPIEFEGEEIILTAPVSSDTTQYDFNGKKMTAKEIASELNVANGGVSFKDGGQAACKCSGKMYKWGGIDMSDRDIVKDLNYKGQLAKGIEIEKREHYDTFSALNAGSITIEQAIRKIAEDHLKENPNYYNNY